MAREELGPFMYAETLGDLWEIHNTRDPGWPLGHVRWYPAWKQYVFSANNPCVFSADCLAEITAFLGRLNEERKEDGRD